MGKGILSNEVSVDINELSNQSNDVLNKDWNYYWTL